MRAPKSASGMLVIPYLDEYGSSRQSHAQELCWRAVNEDCSIHGSITLGVWAHLSSRSDAPDSGPRLSVTERRLKISDLRLRTRLCNSRFWIGGTRAAPLHSGSGRRLGRIWVRDFLFGKQIWFCVVMVLTRTRNVRPIFAVSKLAYYALAEACRVASQGESVTWTNSNAQSIVRAQDHSYGD